MLTFAEFKDLLKNPVIIDCQGVDYVGVVRDIRSMTWEIHGVNRAGRGRLFVLLPDVQALNPTITTNGEVEVEDSSREKLKLQFFTPRYDVL